MIARRISMKFAAIQCALDGLPCWEDNSVLKIEELRMIAFFMEQAVTVSAEFVRGLQEK